MFLQTGIDFVAFLRTEMADGTLDQLQVCLYCFAANIFNFFLFVNAVDIGVSPEFQINAVRLLNKVQSFIISQDIREGAPGIT